MHAIGNRTMRLGLAGIIVVLVAVSAPAHAEREGAILQQQQPTVKYAEGEDFAVPSRLVPDHARSRGAAAYR